MTTCLILAAGEAERHNGGNKMLLEVNGEMLAQRTADLIGDSAETVFVVTHQDEPIVKAVTARFLPLKRRWVTETLLSTRSLWVNSTIVVLLGDVFYTHAAMAQVFNPVWHGVAFGKGFNIHALRWAPENSERIADGLRQSVAAAEAHPRTHGAGKLWLFVECCGIPVIDFGDETTDFDSPQEHKRFIEKYGKRNR